VRITFAGSGRDFERQHVGQAGFEYLPVPSRPLPRRPWQFGSFLIENLRGYRRARRFLAQQCVAVVVGLGGFASAPMARAAVRHGIPLVLLEQNVVPGRTTRWLAKSATFLCASIDETAAHLDPRCPVLVTGNPVRSAFSSSSAGPLAAERQRVRPVATRTRPASHIFSGAPNDAPDTHDDATRAETSAKLLSLPDDQPGKQLLILGGSSGARSLNENVPRALAKIDWALSGWQIVHQAGHGNTQATRRLYRTLGVDAVVVPFISDMASTLAQTDLAICRAGGTTLAELAAAAVPAILLPYPHAADDHQLKNAQWVAASEGGIVVDQRKHPNDLVDHLADTLGRLLSDHIQCEAMSRAMHTLARPEAANEVAGLIGLLVMAAS
jgi:UDP-N-acetylglucosamine--N-acetylmuramyl-(pentapeptide) pyrophosphoryl-undecaprenol N-acetylglucosamine transferase